MNYIMIYDKDEDQKTVNLKLKTVRLWIAVNWQKKKKKLNHNQDCFQTEQRLLHRHEQCSRDNNLTRYQQVTLGEVVAQCHGDMTKKHLYL